MAALEVAMRRKLSLLLLVFVFSLLVACFQNTLSLIEIEKLPNKSMEEVDPTAKLQLVNDGQNRSYIIYRTEGPVTHHIEADENIVRIHLDKEDRSGQFEEYIYKLTTEEQHDTIQVIENGKEIPFDRVLAN